MTPPSDGRAYRARTQHYSQSFYDINSNERRTPINYDDANDHRNYLNGPDLSLPNIHRSDGLVYNDFDYVGFQSKAQAQRSMSQFYSINTESPRARTKSKTISKATSPRIISGGVARKDDKKNGGRGFAF